MTTEASLNDLFGVASQRIEPEEQIVGMGDFAIPVKLDKKQVETNKSIREWNQAIEGLKGLTKVLSEVTDRNWIPASINAGCAEDMTGGPLEIDVHSHEIHGMMMGVKKLEAFINMLTFDRLMLAIGIEDVPIEDFGISHPIQPPADLLSDQRSDDFPVDKI
tara:strand:+ start:3606 stop:4091 length:486 start_codon:yes stop_codon:yes gene_type:complete